MDGMLPAPVAKLFVFDLPLNQLLIFCRVIITPLANGAAERDQFICALYLGHGEYTTTNGAEMQLIPSRPAGRFT